MSIPIELSSLRKLLDVDFPRDATDVILQHLSIVDCTVVHIATDLLLSEEKINKGQADHLKRADPDHFLVNGGYLRGDKLTYPYLLRMGRTNLYLRQERPALTPWAALNPLPDRYIEAPNIEASSCEKFYYRKDKITDEVMRLVQLHGEQGLEALYSGLLQSSQRNPLTNLSTASVVAILIGSTLRKAPLSEFQTHLDELFTGKPQHSAIFLSALASLPESAKDSLQGQPLKDLRDQLFRILPLLFVFLGGEEEQLNFSRIFLHWTLERDGREEGLAYLADALTQCNSMLTEKLLPDCLEAMENVDDFILPVKMRTEGVFCRFLLAQHRFSGGGSSLPWLRGIHLSKGMRSSIMEYCAAVEAPEALKAFFRRQGIGKNRFLHYEEIKQALKRAAVDGREEVMHALCDAVDPESLLSEKIQKHLPKTDSVPQSITKTPPLPPSPAYYFSNSYCALKEIKAGLECCRAVEREGTQKQELHRLVLLTNKTLFQMRSGSIGNLSELLRLLNQIKQEIQNLHLPHLPYHFPNSSLSYDPFTTSLPYLALDSETISNLAAIYLLVDRAQYSPALRNRPLLQREIGELVERASPLLTGLEHFNETLSKEEGKKPVPFLPRAPRIVEEAPAAPPTTLLGRVWKAWNWVSDLSVIRSGKKAARIWIRCATYFPRLAWHRILHTNSWKNRTVTAMATVGIALLFAHQLLLCGTFFLIATTCTAYEEFGRVQQGWEAVEDVASVSCTCLA